MLYMPMNDSKNPTNPPSDDLSILIVEDNPVFIKQLDQAITELGVLNRSICETGNEALLQLAQASMKFDVALVDLGLPDIDGVKIVAAIRERFPEIPIMVITVVSSEKSLLAAIRSGANGYILKSDTSMSIKQAVSEVLSGNYPISPSLARTLFKLAGSPAVGTKANQYKLTPRELETLKHIAAGQTYEQVAELMGISVNTIQTNIRSLYKKMGAHSQTQAIAKARNAGII